MISKVQLGNGTIIGVDDDGVRIGPALVLIHGWPVTDFHWRKIKPQLTNKGFRTISITPRGLGQGSSGNGDFDKLTIAMELSETLDKLSVKDFAVIGHDWGGTLGYLMAVKNKEKCWALVVEEEIFPGVDVEIPEPGSNYYPDWHGPFNRAEGLGEVLLPGSERVYYGTFLRQSAGKNPLDEVALERYLAGYESKSQIDPSLGYYRTRKKDIADVYQSRLDRLNIPILALGGEYGMGSAVESGLRDFGKDISSSIIPNSGHYPSEQEPELVLKTLVPFLISAMKGWRKAATF